MTIQSVGSQTPIDVDIRGPGEHEAGPKAHPLPPPEEASAFAVEEAVYDWDEIRRHNRPGDFWVVVAGGVYNVSEWMFHHPGGTEVYLQGASSGQDLTEKFLTVGHSPEALNLTRTFRIGQVRDNAESPASGKGTETPALDDQSDAPATSNLGDSERRGPLEIPYAVRWLVPRGERFANYEVLNDNDTQLDYYRRFGHVYAVGIPTKKWRLVMVSDPWLLTEVAENTDQFGKQVEEINFFDQLASSRGGGISVVSDSEDYEKVRRVMLPWYAPAHQKTQLERMKAVARRMMASWAAMPDDQSLDMRDWMTRYCLEISGLGACNYAFDLVDSDTIPNDFGKAVPASTKESVARIVESWPDLTLLSGPQKRARKRAYREHNEVLFSTAEALVRGRMHTCPAGTQTDLLGRLLSVPDPETGTFLDPDTIRDQLLMHLSNGFNGPSFTGSWLAYVLATNPDVEAKLVAEIDSVAGGDPDYDLQYKDLLTLPYTTQVIKETLRIYPPMPVTVRRSLKDGMLGPYRIRKRDIILVGALAAQRDTRLWGPDPERFDPEQFTPERVVKRPMTAFIPFSVGPRQCMAQEVTFMMLRVALFEIYNRYRLRMAPDAVVIKNTAATTKPEKVEVVRLRRGDAAERRRNLEIEQATKTQRAGTAAAGNGTGDQASERQWDQPSEIPSSSAFGHLVVAFGSNFGSNKQLAETFAERSGKYGFTSEVMTLDQLIELPERAQPWLLVAMTATYTGNPPGNAIACKAWLDATEPGGDHWRNCRYLVWGLGNSQWNAFMAFPRYMHQRLQELGASPMSDLAFGDVGTPGWEETHEGWNDRTWPQLIDLAGARASEAAAARYAAEQEVGNELASADSATAMAYSLAGKAGEIVAPTIMTNSMGISTVPAVVDVCRELHAAGSLNRARHVEVTLPEGFEYRAGDHLGVCPQNAQRTVRQLADRLGAPLDGVFIVPKSMPVHAVPRGVPLQVRNVLTSLIDITGMPSKALLELLLDKVDDPDERHLLAELLDALVNPDDSGSRMRAAFQSGGYDVMTLLDALPSCHINIFELLEVAQPLRPRYYSTCSSPRVHPPQTAHVTVGFQPRPVPDVPGAPDRVFRGLSAAYVHALRRRDRINVFVDQAEGFHLQEDVTKPMIFVSAGTGFAPMRAFLWERLALCRTASLGRAVLFNGIRHQETDYVYREEIEMFVKEGALDEVIIAASREDPDQKVYVQDRIRQHGSAVWQALELEGYVYVCGSPDMRHGVRQAFVDIIKEHGGMSLDEASTFLEQLETDVMRYRADVWG